MKKQVTIEVVRGVEGSCLSIEDRRVAGPKPWGGGRISHEWKTDPQRILEAIGVQKEIDRLNTRTAQLEVALREIEHKALYEPLNVTDKELVKILADIARKALHAACPKKGGENG